MLGPVLFERVEKCTEELEGGTEHTTAQTHQTTEQFTVALHGTTEQSGSTLDHTTGSAGQSGEDLHCRSLQRHPPTTNQTRIMDLAVVQDRLVRRRRLSALLGQLLDLAMDVVVITHDLARLLVIGVVVQAGLHLARLQARLTLALDVDVHLLVHSPLGQITDRTASGTQNLERGAKDTGVTTQNRTGQLTCTREGQPHQTIGTLGEDAPVEVFLTQCRGAVEQVGDRPGDITPRTDLLTRVLIAVLAELDLLRRQCRLALTLDVDVLGATQYVHGLVHDRTSDRGAHLGDTAGATEQAAVDSLGVGPHPLAQTLRTGPCTAHALDEDRIQNALTEHPGLFSVLTLGGQQTGDRLQDFQLFAVEANQFWTFSESGLHHRAISSCRIAGRIGCLMDCTTTTEDGLCARLGTLNHATQELTTPTCQLGQVTGGDHGLAGFVNDRTCDLVDRVNRLVGDGILVIAVTHLGAGQQDIAGGTVDHVKRTILRNRRRFGSTEDITDTGGNLVDRSADVEGVDLAVQIHQTMGEHARVDDDLVGGQVAHSALDVLPLLQDLACGSIGVLTSTQLACLQNRLGTTGHVQVLQLPALGAEEVLGLIGGHVLQAIGSRTLLHLDVIEGGTADHVQELGNLQLRTEAFKLQQSRFLQQFLHTGRDVNACGRRRNGRTEVEVVELLIHLVHPHMVGGTVLTTAGLGEDL